MTEVDRYRSLLDTYRGLVGSVYPGIVYQELMEMWNNNVDIRDRWYRPKPPTIYGRAPWFSNDENVV